MFKNIIFLVILIVPTKNIKVQKMLSVNIGVESFVPKIVPSYYIRLEFLILTNVNGEIG